MEPEDNVLNADVQSIDVPSYTEFFEMDRVENDPDDVADILEICEGE